MQNIERNRLQIEIIIHVQPKIVTRIVWFNKKFGGEPFFSVNIMCYYVTNSTEPFAPVGIYLKLFVFC